MVTCGMPAFSDLEVQKFDEEDRTLIANLKKRGRGSKASEGKPVFQSSGPRISSTEGPLPLWCAKPCLQALLQVRE